MSAPTAVSVDELQEMLDQPAECDFPTLEPEHEGCTRWCKQPAVGRWASTHEGEVTEHWACQQHEAMILNGHLDFCRDGHMVLWTPV